MIKLDNNKKKNRDIRKLLIKIPLLPDVYRMLRRAYAYYRLNGRDAEDIFTDIFKKNKWGGKESVSGIGSELQHTKVIISEVQILLRELGIKSMLDIPCGDFNWMRHLDLNGIQYTGADIVEELITLNTTKYEASGISFKKLNLIRDELPVAELIICRDCLVHLSFRDIFCSLKNISESRSKYLLTTTYSDRKINRDIYTGQWHSLNLEMAPFFLPRPIKIIKEYRMLPDGTITDKSLGLWNIDQIRESLKSC